MSSLKKPTLVFTVFSTCATVQVARGNLLANDLPDGHAVFLSVAGSVRAYLSANRAF
ncbi:MULTISPECIES: hypothetical protein [unclassified Pseudomonas]|uniref:hypothetical protein n=1 Tax=unclassified Pseudomonas TaxID=196821 RepID=UPI0013E191CD|nr:MULTISPECIES: hypothetical protein [unclassified Pseudomonas]QIH10144.1 hypothetical protein ATY02_27180 [Pseudomonas sp. BIOMIG1BAC]